MDLSKTELIFASGVGSMINAQLIIIKISRHCGEKCPLLKVVWPLKSFNFKQLYLSFLNCFALLYVSLKIQSLLISDCRLVGVR